MRITSIAAIAQEIATPSSEFSSLYIYIQQVYYREYLMQICEIFHW